MSTYTYPLPIGGAPPSMPGSGVSMQLGTPAPPSGFAGAFGSMTGRMTTGPSSLVVPSLGTPQTGQTSTLYNGGTPGNRQMGMFWAQESVKQQFVIVNDRKVDPDGAMTRNLSEGMLLFNASKTDQMAEDLRKEGATMSSHPVDNMTRHYGSKLCVAYDINGVNYMLQSNSYRSMYNAMTAEDILASWRPLGVLKVEAAPNRTKLGDVKSSSRLVNLVVSHRVRTFNIWGGDISLGTRLYIICKKVPASSIDRAYSGKRGRDDMSAQESEEMVWVLYPYADKARRTPPMSELTYTEGGMQKLGAYINIGFSMDETNVHNESQGDWSRALRYASTLDPMRNRHLRLLDTMEIQLCC